MQPVERQGETKMGAPTQPNVESGSEGSAVRAVRETPLETETGGETLLSLSEAAQAVGTTVQALWLRVQRGELAVHRVQEGGRTSTAVALRDILELYMDHPQGRRGPTIMPAPQSDGGQARDVVAEPEIPPLPPEMLRVAEGEPSPAPAPEPSLPSAEVAAAYEVPRPAHEDDTSPPASAERASAGSAQPGPLDSSPGEAFRDELARQRAELDRLRGDLLTERSARSQAEGSLSMFQQMEAASRKQVDRLETRLEKTEADLSEAKREALTLARALGQAEGQVNLLTERVGSSAPEPRKKKRRWWRRSRR